LQSQAGDLRDLCRHPPHATIRHQAHRARSPRGVLIVGFRSAKRRPRIVFTSNHKAFAHEPLPSIPLESSVSPRLAFSAIAPMPANSADPAVKPLKALLVLGGCLPRITKPSRNCSPRELVRGRMWKLPLLTNPDTTNMHLNPVYEKPAWRRALTSSSRRMLVECERPYK